MRLVPLLLVACLLLAAAPALAESARERNASFLRAFLPEDALARSASLQAALDAVVTRAGDADLAALAAGAAPDAGRTYAGDVWILETGPGPCDVTRLAPGSPRTIPLHAQLWLYEGDLGLMRGGGSQHRTVVVAWTMHVVDAQGGAWSAVGNSDFACVDLDDGAAHVAWPLLDGVVTFEEAP